MIDLGIDGLSQAEHRGSGGHAAVYSANKLVTGHAVAVKILKASARSERELVRFQREQDTLEKLSEHEGIVSILG